MLLPPLDIQGIGMNVVVLRGHCVEALKILGRHLGFLGLQLESLGPLGKAHGN